MNIPAMEQCDASTPRRIGLIAGWGRYPVVIGKSIRASGHEFYCVGVREHADPELRDVSTCFEWIGLAKLGAALRFFQRHGVTDIMMAGKIHKRLLFRSWAWWRLLPDWTTIRLFAPHFLFGKKDCKDDSLLLTVVDHFAENGVRFGPPTDYVPELLVKEGALTRREPTSSQWKDIRFGWDLAKEMGRLDVGQSVVVKHQAALAIEAIEGTDECIRRAGQLCPSGGFTVVKVAKPQQDMRFDVPAVGLKTLRAIVESGGSVLAVEADMTILLDREEVITFAQEHGLSIVAVSEERLAKAA